MSIRNTTLITLGLYYLIIAVIFVFTDTKHEVLDGSYFEVFLLTPAILALCSVVAISPSFIVEKLFHADKFKKIPKPIKLTVMLLVCIVIIFWLRFCINFFMGIFGT